MRSHMWGISRQIHQAETTTFFFSEYVIDSHKKMTHHFSGFFERSSGSNGRNYRFSIEGRY